MNDFTCCSLSPIGLSHTSLAIATTHAGGMAILDREFCPDSLIEKAVKNLKHTLKQIPAEQSIGLRLRLDQIKSSRELLNCICHRQHWLVFSGISLDSRLAEIKKLPKSDHRYLVIELTDAEQLEALRDASIPFDAILAKGNEAGGRIGEDSSFILSQKLLKQQDYPVYVQGGIGIHTAAACKVGGAAGVVLDDTLLLMPESPLSPEIQQNLMNLSGNESMTLEGNKGQVTRVFSRPGLAAVKELQHLSTQLAGRDSSQKLWAEKLATQIGWGNSEINAWPIGQGVGLAELTWQKYKTTGRYIQALLKASGQHLEICQKHRPLEPGSPLAKSHGTPFPIVQGPMTRVSDSATFAAAIANEGALPLLALALMKGKQVEELLEETNELLGNRPWGIGILGFVPQELRREQLDVVLRIKPKFALIAGGRPDQANKLEKEGIATYIHVPTRSLLEMFLEQGAHRFVFEGRECGGHIGPLSSFVLWESIIVTLLARKPSKSDQNIHLLFAGGIHDALSAAMVSCMAAPLAQRGIKFGVLMGSAYLFTDESVKSRAIVDGYQQEALKCTRTVRLETGPGHAIRCATTQFAREFFKTRAKLVQEKKDPNEIKEELEDLTLGRLRVASKGKMRKGSQIVDVETAKQHTDGMYMLGQVVTLHNKTFTIKELHTEVSKTSTDLIKRVKVPQVKGTNIQTKATPSDIAIIGIGTLFPKAQYPETYWENIVAKVNTITEIPASRWDWRLYYDTDKYARDKINSKWGSFLDDIAFDPFRFGIPPNSLKYIEPMQLLALEGTRRALLDAGYENGGFERKRTCVIIGASGGLSDLGQQYATRSEIPRMVVDPDEEALARLPEWTEESFPGIGFYAVAGRVANRFDLGGSNYVVDAACASSLAAIDLAVSELETRKSNLAIAGGVDTLQSPFVYTCFSKTHALSPRGMIRTFDQSADGIVLGEGVGILVLKRLKDAKRDGDKIYAVIKSVASSSDGKGMSMTAPASVGQQKALQRAYEKAGIEPKTVGLYEAHGTGTAAGDKTEVETIQNILKKGDADPKSCALGSIKTLIAHTKSTAGVASLIKIALSLYHKVLPPHCNIENPLPDIVKEENPLYLLKDAKPWLKHPDYPRRAGVNAFGFGGTNFTAILEEYSGSLRSRERGGNLWPFELFVWRSMDRNDLAKTLINFSEAVQRFPALRLRDLAFTCLKNANKISDHMISLSITAGDHQQLITAIEIVLQMLEANKEDPRAVHAPPQIVNDIQLKFTSINTSSSQTSQKDRTTSKIAFLFPGQVAQYPGMAREVGLYLDEMAETLEWADGQMQAFFPKKLSDYFLPPATFSETEEAKSRLALTDTHVVQPAIGAVELGYIAIAEKLGLKADMVGGHSYGEYAALHASGVLTREDFLRLSEIRGRVMANACEKSEGTMAAVQATREKVLNYLEGIEDVIIANHNAPLQVVITGGRNSIHKVVERLEKADIMVRILPVSGAFHSPQVASAQKTLADAINSVPMANQQIPVYSNSSGKPYEKKIRSIRNQLKNHLLNPVEFVEEINAMYSDGARVFVELGPRQILTRLVKQILEGKEFTAVSLDKQNLGLKGFLNSLGTLLINGVHIDLEPLFEGRECKSVNLSDSEKLKNDSTLPKTAWLLNGGSIRTQQQNLGLLGKIAPLNKESKSMALKRKAESTTETMVKSKINLTSESRKKKRITHENLSPQSKTIPRAEEISEVYQSYQKTMQKFLEIQEQVMMGYLSGESPDKAGLTTSRDFSTRDVSSGYEEMFEPPISGIKDSSGSTTSTPVMQAENNEEFEDPTAQSRFESTDSRFDRDDFTKILLEIVSERTGYPPEMLELNLDMEADLGIDSIKRVEIFGVLRERLPEAVKETVQDKMEVFTEAKTLDQVINILMDLLPATSGNQGTKHPVREEDNEESKGAAAQPESELAGTVFDRDDFTKILLEVVSERTGYPPEMLELTLDMEADLGIDSIKRVEIFGALRERLPEAVKETVQDKMEVFTEAKTLDQVINILMDLLPVTSGKKDIKLPVGVKSNGESKDPAPQSESELADTVFDRDDFTKILLKVVSERTGYPPEMLELTLDMEADLGIDSIKRVEIFGALRERLPEAVKETVQDKMEIFTEAKTLDQVINILMDLLPATTSENQSTKHSVQVENDRESKGVAVQSELELASKGFDRDDFTKILLEVVSERTGYPPEMLELTLDMEADLGIDSIKRVEIFGALRERLPEAVKETVQDKMEVFTEAKTLDQVIDVLLTSASQIATNIGSPISEEAEQVEVSRYVVRACKRDLQKRNFEFTGLFLITDDNKGHAKWIADALKKKGADSEIIENEILANKDRLKQVVSRLRMERGPVIGILHLSGLSEHTLPRKLATWREITQIQSKSLFHLIKLCYEDLQHSNGQVIAATQLGGYFARKNGCGPSLPCSGSSSGLLKTMRIEWTEVKAKVIDFDKITRETFPSIIIDELADEDSFTEIGYCNDVRHVFEPVLKPLRRLDKPLISPQSGWTILCIGGARGITAEVVDDLLVPGITLVLVGRSPEPSLESEETRGISGHSELRRYFVNHAQNQGIRPTPVQIEEKIRNLEKNRQIHRNLDHFRESGAEVYYYSIDVRDEQKFGGLLEKIYDKFGKIDAVIQGAGILEDKLLVDKTDDSFDRVFDTKVDSTFILHKYLRPESLQLFILFASVAGRTGNRGQGDYAAANEVVNRFAWRMASQWNNTKVIAVNWGPWDVVGMATEEVNKQFRERGIIPIPPDAGRNFMINEYSFSSNNEVELIAGIFEEKRNERKETLNRSKKSEISSYPFLVSPKLNIQNNGVTKLLHEFSLSNELFLHDHRLGGKAIVPATVAMELMAEFVQTIWSDWVVCEAVNLHILKGIVIENGMDITLQLNAQASTLVNAEEFHVTAEIIDQHSKFPNYRSTFILRPELPDPPNLQWSPLTDTESIEPEAIYREYLFHGPLFQLIRSIDKLNNKGYEACAKGSDIQKWFKKVDTQTQWLFDPGLIDACLQPTTILVRKQGDSTPLPSQFGRVARYKKTGMGAELHASMRVRSFNANTISFDLLIINENGMVQNQLNNIVASHSKRITQLVLENNLMKQPGKQ